MEKVAEGRSECLVADHAIEVMRDMTKVKTPNNVYDNSPAIMCLFQNILSPCDLVAPL